MKTKGEWLKEESKLDNEYYKKRKEEIKIKYEKFPREKLLEIVMEIYLDNDPPRNFCTWYDVNHKCHVCHLEYTDGKSNIYCDNCYEKNKNKTLAELSNE